MPETIMKEITLYTFKELVELEAKGEMRRACEKARDWLQEGATECEWWDFTHDKWRSDLKEVGFNDIEINFSGFWSQGDGASFTCKYVDSDKLIDCLAGATDNEIIGRITKKCGGIGIDKRFNRLKGLVSCSVNRRSSHYCHEMTCGFDVESDIREEHARLTKLLVEFEEACEELRKDICHAIYKDLETEFEWRTSDEQLIEDAEANDWKFTKSGRVEFA